LSPADRNRRRPAPSDSIGPGELLRGTIDRDRFPLSPRMRPLRSILEKLGIRLTLAVPGPAPKPKSRLVAALAKNRRR
jgi:hypothetical protein